MTKRQIAGVGLILLPGTLLVLVLILQIIARFIFNFGDSGGGSANSMVNGISIILGFISVIGMLPSIIVGIVLLATKSKSTVDAPQDYPSNQSTINQ